MSERTRVPVNERSDGEGVWWQRGVGGAGEHPGCTCPMTGEKPSLHDDNCAAHDDDARVIEHQRVPVTEPPENDR